MYFFDLHCDTITRLNTGERLEPGDRSLRRNGAHIDLERMEGLSWCQCFAVFMPDGLRGRAAIDYYEQSLRFFRTQLAENKDRIVQVRTADEILAAVKDGKCAALLTVEGGSVLAGEPSRAAELAADGVRMLTLTWNGENELGSGADMPGGLTPRGVKAVEACEDAGIIIDVSHLNDRGFGQMADLARRPFVASHSNARAVCSHRRNLTDEQFMRIVAAKGLVGLNFCTHFLSEEIADPPFSCLAAHIEHFLSLGGEQTLALGSDYDGTDVPSWLDPARKVEDLYQLVCGAFGQALANRLFFENALDFMKRYELAGEG
ncbi:membrane dipeptidase [Anaerotruncus colihominis]|uniref:dipeptidase n=1 Tax=Anaerotruncus colihominis TaxID=169435 RepID=UPI0017499A41|nr:membrane dipeptidase [Anaerotruncus colihominis]HJF56848.1 membrane dipeptidase [Anaerotruncus colihominis]